MTWQKTQEKPPQPESSMNTLVDLLDMIDQPECEHKINSILFSVSFLQLRVLQKLALKSDSYDFSSAEYRVVTITSDIANYGFFKPVGNDVPADPPKILYESKIHEHSNRCHKPSSHFTHKLSSRKNSSPL